MGDSDCSYDFGEVPRFLGKLEEGYDLVMGNRFAGGIMPGAMPWHHRYIGNPILSGLGRLLYRTPCRDWHCGLRAFNRAEMKGLGLKSSGMEFASEMVLRCANASFAVNEIPIKLHPDGRNRPPYLRSFPDGFRRLAVLLLSQESWLFRRTARVLIWVLILYSTAFALFQVFVQLRENVQPGFRKVATDELHDRSLLMSEISIQSFLCQFTGPDE
jgi:hypothetical protein